ncbi:MAG: hypothetical protein DMG06_27465 [Acidobacteria bacterium]|nr:MAG: hypothetical protein DMG06_27465 [Acidobacteriota bacterium]
MDLFGLSPTSVTARAQLSAAGTPLPTLKQSLCYASVSFCLASLAVFAIVGYGEPWMRQYLGVLGPYIVATAFFILLAGGILSRLVVGPGRLVRFYLLFGLAFFCYAASWVIAYLTLRSLIGELLGSLVGTGLMALILAGAFGAKKALTRMMPALLVANSAGYFLGRVVHEAIGGKLGMILFGACYGLGFGTGLGYALFLAQEPIRLRLGQSLEDSAPRP